MNIIKKFWGFILIEFIITLSFCVYAESNKSVSQDKPEYELKSDIINFDYTEMGYPFNEAKIGSTIGTTDKSSVPRKIVKREGNVSEINITLVSIFYGVLFVLDIFGICIVFTFLSISFSFFN